jgi:hypothetical protein
MLAKTYLRNPVEKSFRPLARKQEKWAGPSNLSSIEPETLLA